MSRDLIKLAVNSNLADALFGVRLELQAFATDLPEDQKVALNDLLDRTLNIMRQRDELLQQEPLVPSTFKGLVVALDNIREELGGLRAERTSSALQDLREAA